MQCYNWTFGIHRCPLLDLSYISIYLSIYLWFRSSFVGAVLYTSEEVFSWHLNPPLWPDKTRQDKTRQDKTRQDKTRQDKTRDKTRQNNTKQDKTRQDTTTQDKTRQDTIRQDQDKTRQGKARQSNHDYT